LFDPNGFATGRALCVLEKLPLAAPFIGTLNEQTLAAPVALVIGKSLLAAVGTNNKKRPPAR
jgi:hypothetical protein